MRKIFEAIIEGIGNLVNGSHVDMSYMWDGTLDETDSLSESDTD